MSHHSEQNLHILSENDLQTVTPLKMWTRIETGFALYSRPPRLLP